MNERRSSRRSRTLLDGRIVFNDGSSTIECTVLDVSDTGVQISLPHPINMPREFRLEIPKRRRSARARVVWSADTRWGLSFVDEEHAAQGNVLPLRRKAGASKEAEAGRPASDELEAQLRAILEEARDRIAQAAGISAATVKLKLEIGG